MASTRKAQGVAPKLAASNAQPAPESAVTRESLEDEARTALEEARMVLPGIQALLGFQLISVFSQQFNQLSDGARLLHLGALGLVVVAIALLMAPAAYHRIAERGQVSRHFLNLTSRFMTLAMLPLMLAIPVDLWVVSTLVTDSTGVSVALALGALILYAGLWFAFPLRTARLRRRVRHALARHAD